MFPKAVASGADTVVIDLEDAVLPERKEMARRHIREWYDPGGPAEVVVRVNPAGEASRLYDDLELCAELALPGFFIPKAEKPRDIAAVDALLSYLEHRNGRERGSIGIGLILETAGAVVNCAGLVAASSRVSCIVAGGGRDGDTARSLGYRWTPEGDETAYLRGRILLEARAAGVGHPVYSGWMEVRDLDGLERDAVRTRNLGYAGQMVIHPSHVPVCNRVYAPTEAELQHLRRVVALFEQAEREGKAAIEVDGSLIDLAMARTAREALSRAGHKGEPK
jgi:citrate lyase subunit beta/citryl-CoA lyase